MLENLKKVCESVPEKKAYIGSDGVITYSELYNQVCIYSELLKKQGVGPVVILGHKEIDYAIAILSCLMAKRTYVPVDSFMPEDRLKHIVELTRAELIVKCSDSECNFTNSVRLNQLARYKNEAEKESFNETAYIIFTSGSTGVPKGVPISYSNLDNFIKWISSEQMLSIYKDTVVLNQASFSFDLSVADFYYSVFNGHTLVAITKEDMNDFNIIVKKMHQYKVGICVFTPTFMRMCLLSPDFNSDFLPNLKCVYFCGEKLEVSLVKKLFFRFPELDIINAYGPTEATSAVSAIRIDRSMMNVDLLPVGHTGNFATGIAIINDEIVLQGESVFGGYLGGIEGGYYKENGVNCFRTGDNGYIVNDELYCIGRFDSQIKYKGYRIELMDIESNIHSCDGVVECAVIPIKNLKGDVKYIKAFVVLKDGFAEEDIREQLARKLPFYMIPKVFSVLKQLPVNENKKIDRARLVYYD